MYREVVIVPTYRREELLHCCLRRLRGLGGDIPIIVFSDRGETSENLERTCQDFEARLIVHPKHNFYGNSYAAGEALRFSYLSGYDMTFYVEDDCMVSTDFFRWTSEVQDDWRDIFCSCAWVFNRAAAIENETYFVPWVYIPQFTIRRDKLALLIPHLNPIYYSDLQKYVFENFHNNPVDALHPHAIQHFEVDGLLQRVLMQNKMQVAWNGIAKAAHVGGWGGYNKGGYEAYESFFEGLKTFPERVARVEEFIADPYWRMQYFDRAIVEREEGKEIGERHFRYKITQGEWESEFETDLLPHQFPVNINSVPLTKGTIIELL